jgi:hypothetical protein
MHAVGFFNPLVQGYLKMRRLFGAAFAASLATFALAVPAQAQTTRTLGGQTWNYSGATILDFSTAQPPGNQPQNNPCIICGANQPNQTNTVLGFGYTDYGNQGNQTSETYFSSGILRDTVLGSDTISAVNYSGAQLKAAVTAIGGVNGGFNIGIDVNDTNHPQTLESFFFLDLTSHTVLAAFLPNINDGIDLLAPNNGTGFPDFQLTGLSTLGLIDNHQYAFFARMSNTNDGPDSFFITPGVTAAVPLPAVGSGLPMLVAGMVGLVALNRKRKARLNATA